MKKIISLLLAFTLCFCMMSTAYAEVVTASVDENAVISAEGDGSNEPTRVEETKWYYRTTEDGLLQARLWSITNMVWLTDWITIGHV